MKRQYTEHEKELTDCILNVCNSRYLKDCKRETEILNAENIEVVRDKDYSSLYVRKNKKVVKYALWRGAWMIYEPNERGRLVETYKPVDKFNALDYLNTPRNTAKNPVETESLSARLRHEKKWIFDDVNYYERQIAETREQINRYLERLQNESMNLEKARTRAKKDWQALKNEYLEKAKKGV